LGPGLIAIFVGIVVTLRLGNVFNAKVAQLTKMFRLLSPVLTNPQQEHTLIIYM
jgi:hypothetical protein